MLKSRLHVQVQGWSPRRVTGMGARMGRLLLVSRRRQAMHRADGIDFPQQAGECIQHGGRPGGADVQRIIGQQSQVVQVKGVTTSVWMTMLSIGRISGEGVS